MFKTTILMVGISLLACNTTAKQETARTGASLDDRICYQLNQSDCSLAQHCQYDLQQYVCTDLVSQVNTVCSNYSSEFDCPRSQCRWSGYSCDSLTNSQVDTNSQCQYYNNDPTGCQNQGCLYQNSLCQIMPSTAYPSGTGISCSAVYQANTCASTPGCQWLNNICQNTY
ncbi:hypothetical protein N9D31_02555 [Oligoflexaceae bacterium]|nr:hypothetical protein [Oligoflexaceae bacterium]